MCPGPPNGYLALNCPTKVLKSLLIFIIRATCPANSDTYDETGWGRAQSICCQLVKYPPLKKRHCSVVTYWMTGVRFPSGARSILFSAMSRSTLVPVRGTPPVLSPGVKLPERDADCFLQYCDYEFMWNY